MAELSRRTLRVAMAVGVVGLLAGCAAASSGGSSSADGASGTFLPNKGLVETGNEKPKSGGRLVYGLTGETNGWNPSSNQWAPSGLQVTHALFDTLTAFDDSSAIHPFLAQSFEHSADFKTWTFTMRPGVTFTNGKPANAAAVVRNQEFFAKSPITGPAYRVVDSIAASGDDKVVFTLKSPDVQFPMTFESQIGVVADPDWLESNDSLQPIGTGPFVLESWKIGDKLVAKRNPNYWQKDASGEQLPYLDSIEYRVIPDSNSRTSALQAGDIDIMESASGTQIQHFTDLDTFQVMSDPKGETREVMVMLNTKEAPFDDPDARRALALATDQQAYVDTNQGGVNPVADNFLAPSSPWYVDSGYPAFDLDKAKALVEQVKARHGGTFEFTVTGIATPDAQRGLQLLQQQWQNAGIKANVDMVEQAADVITVVTGGYQAALWGQFDAPNPVLDTAWWDPSGDLVPPAFTLNMARNDDPEIRTAILAALDARDDASFKAAMGTIQKRLGTDIPYVWLYHDVVAIIADKRVVNIANYTLPDGAKGLAIVQGAHPVAQIWLRS